MQKKKKVRKNNARINEKKRKTSERSEKLHTSIVLGELKCAYTKKKWLKFRIEQSSTRGILNFRAKGIKFKKSATHEFLLSFRSLTSY